MSKKSIRNLTLGGLLILAVPAYAQHHLNNHKEDNPKYESSQEDLSYQGWKNRERRQEEQELRELRQHQIDEIQRHEDFDRLFPKEDENGRN